MSVDHYFDYNHSYHKTYYYLVTRDTNIIVLTVDLSNTWTTNHSKPLTLTGIYADVDYDVTWNISGKYVRAGDDLVIDNMTISSGQNPSELTPTNATGNTTQRYFYGSWFNVKLGRGLTRNGNYTIPILFLKPTTSKIKKYSIYAVCTLLVGQPQVSKI